MSYYKKEISIIAIALVLCLSIFTYIKSFYFGDASINEPIKSVMRYYDEDVNTPKLQKATIVASGTTKPVITSSVVNETIEEEKKEEEVVSKIPYEVAPTFEDDGSIIYEGMTLTELTNKLNNHLKGYLTNTGYFFAKYTKDTGVDPYLNVAIVLLETGCKWTCSSLTTQCNNIGGLKGGKSCNGGSYSKYDTLDEGIKGYLNIIYNNYYLKGMDTPEKMASTYAASPVWAQKVNTYINELRNS